MTFNNAFIADKGCMRMDFRVQIDVAWFQLNFPLNQLCFKIICDPFLEITFFKLYQK